MSGAGLRSRALACRLGLAALLPATVAGAFLLLRDGTPPLTSGELEAARERWRLASLPDYDLHLSKLIDGQAAESVVTEVRSGKARRLLVGGAEVPASDSYTIPGLFETAARELELAAAKEALPGQPRGVVLRARFDEANGAPLLIKRLASEGASYVLRVERLTIAAKEHP